MVHIDDDDAAVMLLKRRVVIGYFLQRDPDGGNPLRMDESFRGGSYIGRAAGMSGRTSELLTE